MANLDKTLLMIIIDRSGSMSGLEDSTIKGFNTFMKEQRNALGEAHASVILFDDRYEILYDKVDVKDIPDLDTSINLARGTTALRDSIGRTIENTKDYILSLNEDDRPGKVLFIITTDGEDNASTDFSVETLSKAIKFQREIHNWEFIFTGASEELVTTAINLGISKGNTLVYDKTAIGTLNNYRALSKGTVLYRMAAVDNSSSPEIYKTITTSLLKDTDN